MFNFILNKFEVVSYSAYLGSPLSNIYQVFGRKNE